MSDRSLIESIGEGLLSSVLRPGEQPRATYPRIGEQDRARGVKRVTDALLDKIDQHGRKLNDGTVTPVSGQTVTAGVRG